jgi:hypothetical protein
MDLLGQKTIQHSELIVSIRNLGALASLYRSVVSFFFFSVQGGFQCGFPFSLGMVCVRAPGSEGYPGRQQFAFVPDSCRANVGSIAVYAVPADFATIHR